MKQTWGRRILLVASAVIGLAALLTPPASTLASESPAPAAQGICPTTSTNTYVQGGVFQYDLDNPVRWAEENADKNLDVRSWFQLLPDMEYLGFVDYGRSSDRALPPQIATLFSPVRVPLFVNTGQVDDWEWEPSPNPGGSLGWITSPAVTVLMVHVDLGEELHTPLHSRNLGAPFGKGGAIVLYADENSITLKFTREDSVARGYTMHIDNICTDPNLLALYQSLDNADRNSIGPGSGNRPRDLVVDYDLPGLTRGQVFGTVEWDQISIAIRDEGTFLDPRSLRDWWRVQ